MGPSVSVIMPVHNGAALLTSAIQSILAQQYQDFELIVVDDGSDDGTADILNQIAAADTRIRALHFDHIGFAAALNAGCQQARGDYLARMDADDIAMPHRLGTQMQQMHANRRIGLLGGAVSVVDARGQALYKLRYPTGDGAIRQALRSDCPFAHPAIIMRRDVYAKAGGYRAEFLHAEDYDLWLRLSEHCEMANLPQTVLCYRVHTSQMSTQHLRQQIISTVGAQIAGGLRRTGSDALLANGATVTLRTLESVVGARDRVANLLVEASAGRALFLALIGDAAGAAELLDWALQIAGWAQLGRRARAKVHLALATVRYRQGNTREALRFGARAAVVDPAHVFVTARKAVAAGVHAALQPRP